jgi:hypothetical protein
MCLTFIRIQIKSKIEISLGPFTLLLLLLRVCMLRKSHSVNSVQQKESPISTNNKMRVGFKGEQMGPNAF